MNALQQTQADLEAYRHIFSIVLQNPVNRADTLARVGANSIPHLKQMISDAERKIAFLQQQEISDQSIRPTTIIRQPEPESVIVEGRSPMPGLPDNRFGILTLTETERLNLEDMARTAQLSESGPMPEVSPIPQERALIITNDFEWLDVARNRWADLELLEEAKATGDWQGIEPILANGEAISLIPRAGTSPVTNFDATKFAVFYDGAGNAYLISRDNPFMESWLQATVGAMVQGEGGRLVPLAVIGALAYVLMS